METKRKIFLALSVGFLLIGLASFWLVSNVQALQYPLIPNGSTGNATCAANNYGSCTDVEYNMGTQANPNWLGGGSCISVRNNYPKYRAVCNDPAPLVNGACGPNATNYSASATFYPDVFCNAGTASPASPAFPAQGGSTTWSCLGSGGGTNASCTATRDTAACTPSWSCTSWSPAVCSNGTQTRTCIDDNACGTATGKPAESQTCTVPFDYSLSTSGNISVIRGGSSGSNTITVSKSAGSAQSVSLSASGLPQSTASFSPTSCTPNNTCTSTLTISVPLTATGGQTQTGTHIITVAGSLLEKTTTFNLVVSDPINYSLSNSGGISVNPGGSGSNTITVSLTGGVEQSISLSASGLPTNATAAWSPSSSCTPNITCTSTLTISTLADTPTGDHTITVTGSPLARTTTFTLAVVPPPSVPANLRVTTATPIIKGTTVNFAWDASAGATYYLVQFYRDGVGTGTWVSPNPITATNINYTDTAGLNTIGALVKACKTGNNCSAVAGATATLTDPPAATADIKASPTVNGTYSNGPISIAYNNAAYLRWSSANAVLCSISPTIAGATIGTSNSTGLSTGNLIANTTYTLTCGGAADSVTVNVASPTLSTVLTPTPTGGTGDTSVTLSATAGGTAVGTINYNFWWNCTDLSHYVDTVSGTCGALQTPTAPLLCASNANGYKCNGITANPPQATPAHTYTPGSYTSKVIVERAGISAENRRAITINVPFTYTLSNSGNKTVNKGSSVTNTITVTKNTGTAESVTLRTALPLPTGVTASFNPDSCSPVPTENTCTSVLTLSASADATAETYVIGVLGSPLDTETGFYLVVQNPPASLTASCSADKIKATFKESVKWSATASGGGTYTYLWDGTTPLATAIINPKTVAYTTTGNKTGRVTVTSGGQSVVADCSNSVDVYAPVLKISPSSVGATDLDKFKVDETRQLAVDYYPHGLANTDTKQDITASAHWFSSSNSIATVNNTNQKGLVKGVDVGNANIYASYTNAYGISITTSASAGTTAAVKVRPPEELTVSIKNHPNSPGAVLVNQDIIFEAKGWIGGYKWSGGGTPAADPSGQNSEFATKYTTSGSKTITVTSGSQTKNLSVTVAQPTLTITSFTSNPTMGKAPLSASLAVQTNSNIESTANYTFWWNCDNDGASVSAVKLVCGDPTDSAIGSKSDGVTSQQIGLNHTYSNSGNYTAKVIVERGSAAPQEKRISITTGKIDIKAQASDGPITLDADTSTSLSWTSENVTSCTASGTGPGWSGSKPVGPYSQSTGVLSQPGTYRYTITCDGSNGLSISDYVDITVVNSLRIDSFTVVPPGKNAGSASEVRAAVSSNITGVTNNYTFYCSRGTPDSDTTVAAGWDHKRDGVAEMSYQADDLCNYNNFAPGVYTAKVIVERGGLARAAHVDIVVPVNVAPAVNPIAPAAPANYCASPFGWVLKWNFSDAGGDSQYSYRVVVNDAATAAVVSDSGEVVSSSNSYAIPLGILSFNKTYNWAVRVWESDAARLSAAEIGPSFATIAHAAPALSFNLSPARPSRDEQVTLTDTTVVSGGASKTNWNWDFTGVDGVTLLSPATAQQVVVKFSTSGSKNIKLRITDSDGLSCQKGANDDANDSLPNITVGRSIPLFREVLPR